MNLRALVVDDSLTVCSALEKLLLEKGCKVDKLFCLADVKKRIRRKLYDLVFVGCKLPDGTCLDVLNELNRLSPLTTVVILTTRWELNKAIQAVRERACEFIAKPIVPDEARIGIEAAIERARLILENEILKKETTSQLPKRLLGRSKGMRNLIETINVVAPTNVNVMIYGESGTGKELVAQEIHNKSLRSGARFVEVNCAAIPDTLIEAEFFGYEKGAFTGAVTRKIGRFELADGGSLFLDEISETSIAFQTKLLRAIEEKEFERLGGNKTIKSDVRIIASTNQNLRKLVVDGGFREDLYFRLNVFPIHIPPLRARKEDIPLLADYFIALYSSKNSKPVKEISSEALSWMMEYDWPGNVRELENAVERAVIISTGEEITQKDIVLPQMTGAKESADFGEILPIREMEKRLILKALEKTHGRRTEAARLLGISVRTLRNKLARYEKEGIYVNKMGEVRKEKN